MSILTYFVGQFVLPVDSLSVLTHVLYDAKHQVTGTPLRGQDYQNHSVALHIADQVSYSHVLVYRSCLKVSQVLFLLSIFL